MNEVSFFVKINRATRQRILVAYMKDWKEVTVKSSCGEVVRHKNYHTAKAVYNAGTGEWLPVLRWDDDIIPELGITNWQVFSDFRTAVVCSEFSEALRNLR